MKQYKIESIEKPIGSNFAKFKLIINEQEKDILIKFAHTKLDEQMKRYFIINDLSFTIEENT